MTPLFAALALFLQAEPATAAPAADAAPAAAAAAASGEFQYPAGAPREPYQFVGWCYGMLRGYLDLHDEMMPEVTRIESTYRRPGSKLSDDLKVYAEQQAQGRKDLAQFQRAMTAAEKASLRPINTIGAGAVRKGRAQWNFGPSYKKADKAQAWMGWTLPAACQTAAADLEKRAVLMGASFAVNADPEAAPTDSAPTPAATVETTPAPADTPAAPAAAAQ